MTEIRFCEDCTFVRRESKNQHRKGWACGARPKVVPVQFQVHEVFLHESPFWPCYWLNPDGLCLHFEERNELEVTLKNEGE